MPCATLSLAEFAEMIGVSKRLVYKLVERDDGPPLIRLGRRVLIRREAAEQWLVAREARSAPLGS
jgi:excisionase family DNA binding protein